MYIKMKKITLFFMLILLTITISAQPFKKAPQASTPGVLTITATEGTAGGGYSPKHCTAIWIQDDTGKFVKTLLAYAASRKTHLNNWESATTAYGSAFNTVDAISGSTKTSFATRTCTWDGTNLASPRAVLPDGTYTVKMELTDKNNTGNLATFTFTKGPNSVVLTPANQPSFSNVTLSWAPSTATVTGVSISPNPTSVVGNKSIALTPNVTPIDAANKNVTWESSNTSIATVNAAGLVTGVAEGKATITVTTVDQLKTATCEITVLPASAGTPTGTGTIENPFLIMNIAHLEWVKANPPAAGQYYKLGADIALVGINTTTMFPIATCAGTFDGSGYIISDMTSATGMFTTVSGTIKNLGLNGINIRPTGNTIGAFAGTLAGGTIQNCYAEGDIIGTGGTYGGIAGTTTGNAKINGCYFSGNITSSNTVATTNKNIAGIVGFSNGVSVSNCFSIGTFSAIDAPAGIVGCLGGATAVPNNIENCYTVAKVIGIGTTPTFVGNLVGKNNQKGCDCIIKDCFFNIDSAGVIPGIGGHSNTFVGAVDDAAFSRTSSEMKLAETFKNNGTTTTSWDFDNMWVIYSSENDGYPSLSLVNSAPTAVNNLYSSNFRLFPNPVKDVINYKSNDIISEISIVDISGRILYVHAANKSFGHIDVSFLKQGIYLFKIKNMDGKTQQVKLQKK